VLEIKTRRCDLCRAIMPEHNARGWLRFRPQTIVELSGVEGDIKAKVNVEDVCSMKCLTSRLTPKDQG